jgi:hypothetical protein
MAISVSVDLGVAAGGKGVACYSSLLLSSAINGRSGNSLD